MPDQNLDPPTLTVAYTSTTPALVDVIPVADQRVVLHLGRHYEFTVSAHWADLRVVLTRAVEKIDALKASEGWR